MAATMVLALLTPMALLGMVSAIDGLVVTSAFAGAPREDCDLDGFDDHTGAPLPWAGFDETRGDMVPSGWDGVANSWTGDRPRDGATGSGGGTPGGSTSGGSTSGSPNGSGSSRRPTTSSGVSAGSADGTVTEVVITPQAAGSTAAATGPATAAATTAASPGSAADTATILAARGSIRVADAAGARIHVGSPLKVTGTGFAPNADGLDISLDTTGLVLRTVWSQDDGAFDTQVELPRSVTPGRHVIVVSHGGVVLARAAITVGPPAADTFVKALLVGFSDANAERAAGLLTLAGLAFVGAAAWIADSARRGARGRLVDASVSSFGG